MKTLITLALTLSFALAHAASPQELAAQVIKDNPIKGASKVEATQATEVRYTYWIWYEKGQGSITRARADTQRLIRATLNALVKQGVKPTEDWKFIHAHAAEQVQGETRPMAAELGDAQYDFTTDQIVFKAPRH